MKTIQQLLFVVLTIFITIAASNHYFVNYGYKKGFANEFKRGYTVGCIENTKDMYIDQCEERANSNVRFNR